MDFNKIKVIDGAIYGDGATAEDIKNAEEDLGVKFARDYKEYLQALGALMINGHSLTGLSKSKQLDVALVTRREWEANEKINHSFYVIENASIDGIVYWQNEKGVIYQASYDEFHKAYSSLSDYVEKSVLQE